MASNSSDNMATSAEDSNKDKEPVAGLSAASSCIRLSLSPSSSFSPSPTTKSTASRTLLSPSSSFLSRVNNSVVKKDEDEEDELQQLPFFRPVYTHQLFGNECIPGWRPTLQAEEQSRSIYQSWRRRNNGIDDDNGNNNGVAGEYDGDKDGEDNEEHRLHSSYQHCCYCDDDDEQQQQQQQQQHARIDIHILLSPSCENCQIEIQTETPYSASAKENENYEPSKKRIKVVSFAKEVQEVESNTTTTERKKQMDIKDIVQRISLAVPPIVSLRVNGTLKNDWLPIITTEEDSDKAGIDIAGVVETFAKNKEEGSIVGGSAAAAEGGYLPQPIGQILKTYHRKVRGAVSNSNTKCYVDVDSSTSEFVIALADGSDRLDHHTPPSTVARYHNSVQRLARWYIETADGVDVAEDGRGFWKVMYLFRRHNHNHGDDDGSGTSSSRRRLSLAGYMTLLHVHSPFRKPFPGIIVRVCQAMILPPYHRGGHGSMMLHSLHAHAQSTSRGANSTALPMSTMEILEVNVEDPAPAFVALRDSVDYQRFASLCSSTPTLNVSTDVAVIDKDSVSDNALNLRYLNDYDVTNKEYFLPVSEIQLARALKITKRQAQIVHEVYKLAQVEQWKRHQQTLTGKDTINDGKEDELISKVETNYRLMVKRSLRSFRMEELGACAGGKEEQKILLGRWFEETISHYHRLVLGSDRRRSC